MNIGTLVYYRISGDDADAVNKRRMDAVRFRNFLNELRKDSQIGSASSQITELLDSGYVAHTGNPVVEGTLLPAIVIRAYSVFDLHDTERPVTSNWEKKTFSGFADLRVLLPGNDDLWVPRAERDGECTEISQDSGQGITALPAHGMFTMSHPAPLLT